MLLSIITINYNNLEGLTKTMDSVFSQSYRAIEFIVIDGGSTDGSESFIENHQASLTYWVSEPDNGIYHAMNKGIKKATGDYLLFLNSGDWLVSPNVISTIKPAEFTHDLISCGLHVIGNGIDYVKEVPNEVGFAFMFRSTLPHQSTFIKRSLFKTVGYYDEQLKFVSDWKFFILAISIQKASFKRLPVILSKYNLFGFSSLAANKSLMDLERKTVLITEFEPFYQDFKELTSLRGKISALRKSRWINLLLKMRLINKF